MKEQLNNLFCKLNNGDLNMSSYMFIGLTSENTTLVDYAVIDNKDLVVIVAEALLAQFKALNNGNGEKIPCEFTENYMDAFKETIINELIANGLCKEKSNGKTLSC